MSVMATKTKLDKEKLLRDLAQAQELLEHDQVQEAHDLFNRVRAVAGRTGIRSGHVCWGLAITADLLGRFGESMNFINEALALDPLAGPFNRSFEIITGHIRAALLHADRKADDVATPGLYRLLIQAGEADERAHLAMARHNLATSNKDAALKLVEAIITLYPCSAEAWALRASIAVAMGDHQAAATATAEAAALGHDPVPFAIPGQAEA